MIRKNHVIAATSMVFGGLLAILLPSAGTADASSTRGMILASAGAIPAMSLAHCEVPCGIYDDNMMVRKMLLDAETIKKASAQIGLLSQSLDAASLNTISRWVLVKEEHSKDLQHVNAWYFMTQRVKMVPEGSPGHDDYLKRLAAHHRISVAAMKAAQSLAPDVQTELQDAIKAVAPWYPPVDAGADASLTEENWTRLAERSRP
jgi:nickel superoxide dismutase